MRECAPDCFSGVSFGEKAALRLRRGPKAIGTAAEGNRGRRSDAPPPRTAASRSTRRRKLGGESDGRGLPAQVGRIALPLSRFRVRALPLRFARETRERSRDATDVMPSVVWLLLALGRAPLRFRRGKRACARPLGGVGARGATIRWWSEALRARASARGPGARRDRRTQGATTRRSRGSRPRTRGRSRRSGRSVGSRSGGSSGSAESSPGRSSQSRTISARPPPPAPAFYRRFSGSASPAG